MNNDIRPPKWLTHAMKDVGLEVIDCPSDSRTTENNETILVFRVRNIPTSLELEKLRKKLSNRGFKVETHHPVRDCRPKVLRVQGWTLNNLMNRLESPVNYTGEEKKKNKRNPLSSILNADRTFKPNIVKIESFAMVGNKYVSYIRSAHGAIKKYVERRLAEEIDGDQYYKFVSTVLSFLQSGLELKDIDLSMIMFIKTPNNCHTPQISPCNFVMNVDDFIDDSGFMHITSTVTVREYDKQFDAWRMFTAKACDARFLMMYFVEDKNQPLCEHYKGGAGNRFNFFGTDKFPQHVKTQMLDFAYNIANGEQDSNLTISPDYRKRVYAVMKEALEIKA